MERAILPTKLTVEYCTACAQYPEVIAFNLGSSALDIEVEGVCVLSDICRSIHGDVESQVRFGINNLCRKRHAGFALQGSAAQWTYKLGYSQTLCLLLLDLSGSGKLR